MGRPDSGRPSVVVHRGLSRGWYFTRRDIPRPHVVVRRLRPGLGRYHGGEHGVGDLEPGASGGMMVSGSVFGQHHGTGLPQEAGRHVFSLPQPGGSGGAQVGGVLEDHPFSPVHPGEKECGSGCLVQTTSGNRVRVDPAPGGV